MVADDVVESALYGIEVFSRFAESPKMCPGFRAFSLDIKSNVII